MQKDQDSYIEQIEQIPIIEVLPDIFGIEVEKRGRNYFCKLRNEATASCCIYPATNTWCDFGDGNRGGNVIILVQYLQNMDWHDAVKFLAERYGIEAERQNANAFPTVYEFSKIGIAADLATKNFDFDLATYGLEKTAEFSAKYAMTLEALSKKYPYVYYNVLRARAIPFIAQRRNDYYQSILSNYRLAIMCGSEKLTSSMHDELNETARQLNMAEKIMRRAILNPVYLNYKSKRYAVDKDLEKILNGKIEIEVGMLPYTELKKQANAESRRLVYKIVPYPVWQKAVDKLPPEFTHAAFYNFAKDSVNVAAYQEDKTIMDNFFIEDEESTVIEAAEQLAISSLQEEAPEEPKPAEPIAKAVEQPTEKPLQEKKYNTLVINLFGGPGAGKTTCAWAIAAELKKRGHVVEYVSEVAKEYVWDNDFEKIDGSPENQRALLEEQDKRVRRLMGKVEVIVTDSPILLNPIYLHDRDEEYEKMVLQRFKKQRNFNIFIKRGKGFEQEGRVHTADEAAALDSQIEKLLTDNNLFYGRYSYAQITRCVDNIQTSVAKANGHKIKQKDTLQSTVQDYCNSKYGVRRGSRKLNFDYTRG